MLSRKVVVAATAMLLIMKLVTRFGSSLVARRKLLLGCLLFVGNPCSISWAQKSKRRGATFTSYADVAVTNYGSTKV